MKESPHLSFRTKLLPDGRVIVTSVELGNNCIAPSYMKPLIDKIHETVMFLALRDDNVNKIHAAIYEKSAR